jgi:trimeric autotransporter adhesin
MCPSPLRYKFLLALLSAALLFLHAVSVAQSVTTVAGGFLGDGRQATQASFQFPYGVLRDSSGNTYVSDTYAQRIRKIASTGIISTFAGTGIAGYNGDGGPATSAQVFYPIGMALDPAGEVIFADTGNNRVRKIDLSGNVSTIAGNGTAGYTGDGGPATQASLDGPNYVTYDAAGNLYISDRYNNVVRKVDTTGIITTYAGNGTAGFCGDGGPATSACLNAPKGLTTDSSGDLYITDGLNVRIRGVNAAGTISTIAGNGQKGFSGDGGPATSAAIGNPLDVSYKSGVLYISNAGQSRVRQVTLSNGIINPFIGSTPGYDGDNHAPAATEFDVPTGISAISTSAMLIVDRFNARLRKLSNGVVKTMAGGFTGDGNAATSAALVVPQAAAFDSSGNMYVVEYGGNRVRKVDTTGKITTVAGSATGVSGYTGDGGPAKTALLYFPQAAIVDPSNNIFISDQGNNVIRKVDASGNISTFAANPNFGGGLGFMAFDSSGNLYVADAGACVVWKIDSSGNATVVAGVLFTCGYNGDKIKATSALLNSPWGVAFDSHGNGYIADSGNNRIRIVNTSGIIKTFAGNGTACPLSTEPCGDGGAPTAAQLNVPLTVAVNGGTVYIADESDLRIRKVAGGIISTYVGTGIGGYNGNNLPALSTNLDDPIAVAVNPVTKNVYVVDDVQARVRKVH